MELFDLKHDPYVNLTVEEFNRIPKSLIEVFFENKKFPESCSWTFYRWESGDEISEKYGYPYYIKVRVLDCKNNLDINPNSIFRVDLI